MRRVNRLATRLLAVLVPTVLLLPAAAHAGRVVTRDAVGDVQRMVKAAGKDRLVTSDYAGVDIVRTQVDHRNAKLRVGVRFRELQREPFQLTLVGVRTPQGRYLITVERLGGAPLVSIDRGSRTIECPGLVARSDRRAGTVVTALPTSCLGEPRWVQVGVLALGVDRDPDAPARVASFVDDGHRETARENRLGWGPRVRRG